VATRAGPGGAEAWAGGGSWGGALSHPGSARPRPPGAEVTAGPGRAVASARRAEGPPGDGEQVRTRPGRVEPGPGGEPGSLSRAAGGGDPRPERRAVPSCAAGPAPALSPPHRAALRTAGPELPGRWAPRALPRSGGRGFPGAGAAVGGCGRGLLTAVKLGALVPAPPCHLATRRNQSWRKNPALAQPPYFTDAQSHAARGSGRIWDRARETGMDGFPSNGRTCLTGDAAWFWWSFAGTLGHLHSCPSLVLMSTHSVSGRMMVLSPQ
jgi:hypothetical protein